VLFALIFFASANAQSDRSISIGGHTFTADLDDTWTTDSAEATPYNQDTLGGADGESIAFGADDWTGDQVGMAFFHFENLGPSGEYTAETEYGDSSIYILKPKKGYIETYNPTESDILKHATDLMINPNDLSGDELESLSEEDTEYNGMQAHLVETENEYTRSAVIAFFVDSNTVAVISTGTNKFGGIFGHMSARDIIDSITVE
jgi:hypothetical protein